MKSKQFIKSILKEELSKILNEDSSVGPYQFNNLSDEQKEQIYNVFKDSYEKSVGTSWTKDKFYNRANDWVFFGELDSTKAPIGFIAARKQRSGFYKLTGVAGNPRSILKALKEIKDLPVWGMVSSDIQKAVTGKGYFKTPPTILLKIMYKLIPNSVFGGVDFDINNDGSLTLKYSDVGDAKKYFIGNDKYFDKLKSEMMPTIKDKLSELPFMARQAVKLFLKESKNETILTEDITSGSAIVYHRTGKDGDSPVEGIAADGFRVGGGATYGIGVYTTYNLKSQLTDQMKIYGNIIIECKVNSLDEFLIFDYDIAKKVYGERNHTLDKQLQLILGKEWKLYKNNRILNDLIEKLSYVTFTSDVAYPFYEQFKDTIITKLRGIIFTGSRDGNVLVSYDRENIEPIRFSEDNGQTWVNVSNKTIYQRTKKYDPKKPLNYQHILNKINAGTINQSDYDYIANNHKKFYEHFHYFDTDLIDKIFKNIKTDDDLIELINNVDLDRYFTFKVIHKSKDRDNIIDLIIKKNKNLFSSDVIAYFLIFSNYPIKVTQSLLKNDNNIELMESSIFYILESMWKNKYNIIRSIIYINKHKLTQRTIDLLLEYSNNSSQVAREILMFKKDNDKNSITTQLKPNIIFKLLTLIENFDGIESETIFDFLKNLNDAEIENLLKSSKNPDSIAELIIKAYGSDITNDKLKMIGKYFKDSSYV